MSFMNIIFLCQTLTQAHQLSHTGMLIIGEPSFQICWQMKQYRTVLVTVLIKTAFTSGTKLQVNIFCGEKLKSNYRF